METMMKFICKHCHCQVVSKQDTRPVIGAQHGKHCPRRNRSAKPRFQK